jgi:hypothetical protein
MAVADRASPLASVEADTVAADGVTIIGVTGK